MATDIMGLLTGISKQGISPLSKQGVNPRLSQLTPAQQRMEFGRQSAEGLQRAVGGMFGSGAPIQEQLQAKLTESILGFENKTLQEQQGLIKALQATGQTGLAGQLASQLKTLQAKEKEKQQVEAFSDYVDVKHGKNLGDLVDKGVITPANFDKFVDDDASYPIRQEVTADGSIVDVMYKRKGDSVKPISVMGISSLPEYKVEMDKDTGTYYVINESTGTLVSEGNRTEKAARIEEQKVFKTINDLNSIDRNIGYIDEAYKLAEDETGAFIYPLAQYVPTSDSRQLASLVKTIKSELGLEKLMELKRSSPRGSSGLGALNQAELQMLQNALGELDPAVGDELFLKQLNNVKKHYQRFRQTLLGQTPAIDFTNEPEYEQYVRSVDDEYGNERLVITLTDGTGNPILDEKGNPKYFFVDGMNAEKSE